MTTNSKKLPVLYAACDGSSPLSELIGQTRWRVEAKAIASGFLYTEGLAIEPYIPVERVRREIAALESQLKATAPNRKKDAEAYIRLMKRLLTDVDTGERNEKS